MHPVVNRLVGKTNAERKKQSQSLDVEKIYDKSAGRGWAPNVNRSDDFMRFRSVNEAAAAAAVPAAGGTGRCPKRLDDRPNGHKTAHHIY